MRVQIDETTLEVPPAATLAELLAGMAPHVDPSRTVTVLTVDGIDVDPTDEAVLGDTRLRGAEAIRIGTESARGFAEQRRGELPRHFARIADLLAAVARGFATGLTDDANRVLAVAARELALVLELDRRLGELDGGGGSAELLAVVERVGPRLTEAARAARWGDLAALLDAELVPALRGAAAPPDRAGART
jgi:hypothetical protein